jgi:hypothetical protein
MSDQRKTPWLLIGPNGITLGTVSWLVIGPDGVTVPWWVIRRLVVRSGLFVIVPLILL